MNRLEQTTSRKLPFSVILMKPVLSELLHIAMSKQEATDLSNGTHLTKY